MPCKPHLSISIQNYLARKPYCLTNSIQTYFATWTSYTCFTDKPMKTSFPLKTCYTRLSKIKIQTYLATQSSYNRLNNNSTPDQTYLATWTCRRSLWWRRRGVASRVSSCLCTSLWPSRCRWAACGTGWPPRRTNRNTSVGKIINH